MKNLIPVTLVAFLKGSTPKPLTAPVTRRANVANILEVRDDESATSTTIIEFVTKDPQGESIKWIVSESQAALDLLAGADSIPYVATLAAHAGGGQGSATPITGKTNKITAVATAGDSLVLPAAIHGMEVEVKNGAALSANIFPLGSSDTVNGAGAATAVPLGGGGSIKFTCYVDGDWVTSQNLYTNGAIISSGTQADLPGSLIGTPAAIDVTHANSNLTTATSQAYFGLADGQEGQRKFIKHKTRNNTTNAVITPTNLNKGTTLTSSAATDFLELLFQGGKWNVIANTGWTLA